MSIEGKRVVICGGGLGGLTLASFLFQDCEKKGLRPPTITILERSPSPNDKPVTLHTIGIRTDTGGAQALYALGLEEELSQLHQPATASFSVHDGKSIRYLLTVEKKDGSFRINRERLWHVLYKRLPQDVKILWGQTCTNIVQTDDVVTITLEDGSLLEADLLVAGDGPRSTIRTLVCPNEKLEFRGVAGVLGVSRTVPSFFGDRYGITLLIGSDSAVFFLRQADETTLWNINAPSSSPHPGRTIHMLKSEADREKLHADQELQAELRALAHKTGSEYPPDLHALIDSAVPESIRVLNCNDKLPHRSVGRIAFLGDSAHPVTPFAGNGANLALVDAQTLSKMLTSENDMITALRLYDDDMVKRGTKSVNQGRRVIGFFFSSNFFKRKFKFALLETAGFVWKNFTTIKRALRLLCVVVVAWAVLKVYNMFL